MHCRLSFNKHCLVALLALGQISCAMDHPARSSATVQQPANSGLPASTSSSTATSTPTRDDDKFEPNQASMENRSTERSQDTVTRSGNSPRLAIATPPTAEKSDAKHAPDFRDNADNQPLSVISEISQTGELQHASLTEVSGISASLKTPGVLFAINDSGNSATLYAFSEQGTHLGEWPVNANNRDWEDMSSIWLDGRAYLIIGDTGDNLKMHRTSTFYLVEEPTLGLHQSSPLTVAITLNFSFDDGPRNVEAFSVADNSIYMISKEPVTATGPAVSSLYELTIPEQFDSVQLLARKVSSLPLPAANFESKLAAAMAGVDLNHVTSLDIDDASNTAYLLTYRHVIRIKRQDRQSWADAFSMRGERIYSHNLEQAEALAVAANRAVWITSEKRPAPLWAIPITPPL